MSVALSHAGGGAIQPDRADHGSGLPMPMRRTGMDTVPRRARPRRRVMLVLAPDSSRKISRAGSKPACCRRHARRARAMSGRSCSLARSVFFYMSAQGPPARNDAAKSIQSGAAFLQGQVGFAVRPQLAWATISACARRVRGRCRQCVALLRSFLPSQETGGGRPARAYV